jgi:hypothetical protein
MELVVEIKSGANIQSIENDIGVKLVKNSKVSDVIYLTNVKSSESKRIIKEMNEHPSVEAVEENDMGYHILA